MNFNTDTLNLKITLVVTETLEALRNTRLLLWRILNFALL